MTANAPTTSELTDMHLRHTSEALELGLTQDAFDAYLRAVALEGATSPKLLATYQQFLPAVDQILENPTCPTLRLAGQILRAGSLHSQNAPEIVPGLESRLGKIPEANTRLIRDLAANFSDEFDPKMVERVLSGQPDFTD